jgi:ABC-type polar amino acid transport system, ATPase component
MDNGYMATCAAGVAVVLRNVEKSFGRLRVLNGLELEVGKGEYFVVLGPAGRGKARRST